MRFQPAGGPLRRPGRDRRRLRHRHRLRGRVDEPGADGSSRAGRNPVEPLAERYPEGLVNQGIGAELIAARWKLDREALDEYSARSHQRAAATAASGGFDREIVGVRLPDGGTHTVDETVRPSTTAEGLAGLKPAFYTEATPRASPRSTGRSPPATPRR